MKLELLFQLGYVCKILKGFGMEQELTQFADKILCDDSSSCDEVDNYFATEADIMIDIVYNLHEDKLRKFKVTGLMSLYWPEVKG